MLNLGSILGLNSANMIAVWFSHYPLQYKQLKRHNKTKTVFENYYDKGYDIRCVLILITGQTMITNKYIYLVTDTYFMVSFFLPLIFALLPAVCAYVLVCVCVGTKPRPRANTGTDTESRGEKAERVCSDYHELHHSHVSVNKASITGIMCLPTCCST